MAGSSEKVKKAFDEGRFLDVVRGSKSCKTAEDKLLLGISLFKLGRAHEAHKVLDAVAAESERLARAHYFLALIYRQRDDEGAAEACMKKYLAFYPHDDEAKDILELKDNGKMLMKEPSIDLARIYAQQGHYEQALDIYTQVEKINGLDDDSLKEAHQVQNMYIMKTLQGWIERVKR